MATNNCGLGNICFIPSNRSILLPANNSKDSISSSMMIGGLGGNFFGTNDLYPVRNFQGSVEEMFTAKGRGLFPSPKEITFDCSCPDYAMMCKHVAAVLYGIGSRLDENPLLFFILRNVDVEELISKAISQKSETLLKKSRKKSDRVIENGDISSLFGIEMETPLSTDEDPDETVMTQDTRWAAQGKDADFEQAILDYCMTPRSREELAEKFDFATPGYFIKMYISPLVGAGKISMTLPDKPKSKFQKYYSK